MYIFKYNKKYILEKLIWTFIFLVGISYIRIRKEILDIALSLSRKLQHTGNNDQFDKLILIIQEALPELTKDNEPEIRTRIIDIKEMLKIWRL